MHRQPMAVAFVLAFVGAAAFAIRPGFSAADLWPIVVGTTLTAALTGIVASVLQFLPQRFFALLTLLAAAVIGILVSGLLAAADTIWLRPAAAPVAFVWPCAAAAALLVARADGMRLPRLRMSRRR